MSLRLEADGRKVEVVSTRFPAGESCIRINDVDGSIGGGTEVVTVELSFEGNDDLINLMLLTDALRRLTGPKTLYILLASYFPYARQDRVCNEGESLSVKVVADLINGLKYDLVGTTDLHSAVAGALIDNMKETAIVDLAPSLAGLWNPDTTILVSPDAGANKKVLSLAKAMGYPHVVRADKARDVLSGQITGTAVYSEHVGDKDFLIVDDICDGGRTFIELAKELRKLTTGKVMLLVTHGIFSKGTKVFDGLIDKVYTFNPVGSTGLLATNDELVTVIN